MMVRTVKNLPKKHKMFILGLAGFMMSLALIPAEKATASKDNNLDVLEIGKRYELEIELEKINQTSSEKQPPNAVNLAQLSLNHFEVKKGDNLAIIFKRA